MYQDGMSRYADLISKMYNVRDAGSCEDQAAEPGCDLGKDPDRKKKRIRIKIKTQLT